MTTSAAVRRMKSSAGSPVSKSDTSKPRLRSCSARKARKGRGSAAIAAGRRMVQLGADVDDGDDQAAQGNDAHHVRAGVRHARGGARPDDLHDALDVDGVLLAGQDEGEDFDLRGGGGLDRLADEAFAL